MVMAGQRKIVEVAVIAEKLALCPPCGGCRQRLAEFSGASDAASILCDETGVKKTLALSDLLPLQLRDRDSRMTAAARPA